MLDVSEKTLIHGGWVTHICVSKLAIIGSDNGLSPGRRQDIIWINAGILLPGPLGKNLWNSYRNSIIFIQENAFESVVCEMTAILSQPQCVNNAYVDFHSFPKNWDGTDRWHLSSWKTTTYTTNIMSADDLSMQGAGASAAIELTKFPRIFWSQYQKG